MVFQCHKKFLGGIFIVKNQMNEKELENVSGGGYAPGFCAHLSGKDFGGKYEEALKSFGAKGNITQGNNLNINIPAPVTKKDELTYDNRIWKPVYAYCGWHQGEVIWKDFKGNYLVPTGIEMAGM